MSGKQMRINPYTIYKCIEKKIEKTSKPQTHYWLMVIHLTIDHTKPHILTKLKTSLDDVDCAYGLHSLYFFVTKKLRNKMISFKRIRYDNILTTTLNDRNIRKLWIIYPDVWIDCEYIWMWLFLPSLHCP